MIITNSKAKKKGAHFEHLNYHLLSILIIVYHDLLSDMNSPLMMIPQQLTKWSTSAGTAVSKLEADNAKECYLEIAMKLKQNDSYIIGSATEYKTVYVPFDNATGWEPGKRYIYTLIFGGGYDDHGEPILSPITFDAATVDWADANAGADVNVNF